MKRLQLFIIILAIAMAGQDDPGFQTYMKGYEHVLNGNWSESIDHFEELLKKHPKSAYADDSFFWIAYSKKEQQKNEESITLFIEFNRKYPNSSHRLNADRNIRQLAKQLVKNGKTSYEKYLNTTTTTQKARRAQADALRAQAVIASELAPLSEAAIAEEVASVNLEEANEKLLVVSKELAELESVRGISGDAFVVIDDDNDDSSDEIDLQKQAVYAIYKMKNDEARKDLARIISSKKAMAVRKDALYYYAKLENNIDELISLYGDLKEQRLKKELIYSISKKVNRNSASESSEKIEQFLMGIIKSDNSNLTMKKEAIYRLRYVNPKRAFDVYSDLYDSVSNKQLRKEMIYSIYKTKSPKKNKLLREIASRPNEDISIRKSAIYYLSKGLGTFNDMKNLYIGLQEKDLKKEMIYSFYKLKTEESIDFMIQLLKVKNTDTDIRKSIIYWLGKSKNPKAQKAIRDLLFD